MPELTGYADMIRTAVPAYRVGRDPDEELVRRRASIINLSGHSDAPETLIGGLTCVLASVQNPRATFLHFHGGGYRHGTARDWAAFAERMAKATESRVILPDYRLAPEHPFPAAIRDGLQALAALLAESDARPLILSGDSAGGGLALTIASILKRPTPIAGVALISAWMDLRLIAPSFDRCAATDPIFSRASAGASAEDYLQGIDAADPLASPMLGDLAGLPPVHIQVSGAEVVVDDSTTLATRLGEAGVEVEMFIVPEVIHDWPVMPAESPQSRRALVRLSHFVDRLLEN